MSRGPAKILAVRWGHAFRADDLLTGINYGCADDLPRLERTAKAEYDGASNRLSTADIST
jgi:hypothetical protein